MKLYYEYIRFKSDDEEVLKMIRRNDVYLAFFLDILIITIARLESFSMDCTDVVVHRYLLFHQSQPSYIQEEETRKETEFVIPQALTPPLLFLILK